MDSISSLQNPIVIGLASDETYFPGLLVTVTSILLSTKTTKNIEFHVMDGGILDSSWKKMISTVAKLNPRASIVRHEDNTSSFRSLSSWHEDTLLHHCRVLMPKLINTKQLIYLDSDLIYGRDIEELWDMDFEENTIIAVNDYEVPTDDMLSFIDKKKSTMCYDGYQNERPLCNIYSIPAEARYFNSGVLKINVPLWNKNKISEKYYEFSKKHQCDCRLSNQTPLNFVLWDKTKFISGIFNLFAHYFLFQNSDETVIHFVLKKKPWNTKETYIDAKTHPIYYKLFKEFLICLKIDKQLKFKHESFLNKARRISKNSAPFLWLVYFKIKKIIFFLLRNSEGVDGTNDFLNRIRKYRSSQKDPRMILESKQFMANWRIKLRKLNEI